MRPLPLPVGLLLLLLACRGAGPAHESAELDAELWVDPAARPGGNGTRLRPLQGLGEALARGAGVRVRLAAGRYAGPHRLPAGVQLRGAGAVLLDGVEAPGGATLEGLTLEGGDWGLRGAGVLRLRDVALVGQRLGGLQMRQGQLQAELLQVRSGVDPGRAVGVSLDGPVQAELSELSVLGAFRRGLEVAGGAEVHLEGLRAAGPYTALHVLAGRVALRRGAVASGSGPALFVAGGWLSLRDVIVTGHEYGLQAGREARVEVRGFASLGAKEAGVAMVGARGSLEDVQVLGAGFAAALQFLNSDVTLRGFGVQDAATHGLVSSASRLEASEGQVVRTRADEPYQGDALHVRHGEVRLRAVRVHGAAGVGLLAAEQAQLRAEDLVLTGCSGGGVLAEGRARLQARGLVLEGGEPPGVAVMRGASARLEVVSASEVAELLWADCPQGVRVELGFGLARGAYALGLPCVRVPAH